MNIPDNTGYIFNFQGHGAFDPNGRVSADADDQAIARHNAELAKRELENMRMTGKALLYFQSGNTIGTWDGTQRFGIRYKRESWTNWHCKRTDLWFRDPSDGTTWHGVNIGDNDIVHCKRNK